MKILIDIPDEQTKSKGTFYFSVSCDNGIVSLNNDKYLEECYGIKSTVLPEGQ